MEDYRNRIPPLDRNPHRTISAQKRFFFGMDWKREFPGKRNTAKKYFLGNTSPYPIWRQGISSTQKWMARGYVRVSRKKNIQSTWICLKCLENVIKYSPKWCFNGDESYGTIRQKSPQTNPRKIVFFFRRPLQTCTGHLKRYSKRSLLTLGFEPFAKLVFITLATLTRGGFNPIEKY